MRHQVVVSLEKLLGRQAPLGSTLAFLESRAQLGPAPQQAPPCKPVSFLLTVLPMQKAAFQQCMPRESLEKVYEVLWAEIKHQTNVYMEHAQIGAGVIPRLQPEYGT